MKFIPSFIFVIALSLSNVIMPASVGGGLAFAMCGGDGSGWSWDPDAWNPTTNQNGVSCVPCSYNQTLGLGQKRPAFCSGGGGVVGARISWDYHVAESWTVLLWINGVDAPVPEVYPNGTNRPQAIISFSEFGIRGGDEICAKVVAHGQGQSLESSDPRTCVRIPGSGGASSPTLSTPMNVNIELSM